MSIYFYEWTEPIDAWHQCKFVPRVGEYVQLLGQTRQVDQVEYSYNYSYIIRIWVK